MPCVHLCASPPPPPQVQVQVDAAHWGGRQVSERVMTLDDDRWRERGIHLVCRPTIEQLPRSPLSSRRPSSQYNAAAGRSFEVKSGRATLAAARLLRRPRLANKRRLALPRGRASQRIGSGHFIRHSSSFVPRLVQVERKLARASLLSRDATSANSIKRLALPAGHPFERKRPGQRAVRPTDWLIGNESTRFANRHPTQGTERHKPISRALMNE